MLRLLSGRDHQVMTGVTVLREDRCETFTAVTDLHFRDWSEKEIEDGYNGTSERLLQIIKEAKENIELFHKKQLKDGFRIEKENGIILSRDNLNSYKERIDDIINNKEKYKLAVANYKYDNEIILEKWKELLNEE